MEALKTSPGARSASASPARYHQQYPSPNSRRNNNEDSFSSNNNNAANGSVLDVSVESVAQHELEELIRSTESLSKIGNDLLNFANEYAKIPAPKGVVSGG